MAGKAHVVQVNRQKCRKHGIGKPNHFDQPLFSVSKVLGTYKYVVFFELLLRIFLSKILRRFISVNPANTCGLNDCNPKTARVSGGFPVFVPKIIV